MTSSRSTLATRNGPSCTFVNNGIKLQNGPSLLLDDVKIFNRTGEEAAQTPHRRGRVLCGTQFQNRSKSYAKVQVASGMGLTPCGGDNSHEGCPKRGGSSKFSPFRLLGCG